MLENWHVVAKICEQNNTFLLAREKMRVRWRGLGGGNEVFEGRGEGHMLMNVQMGALKLLQSSFSVLIQTDIDKTFQMRCCMVL